MRIAMWSGPRNISTAMMYAFSARGDCAVVDEPFYAAYLARTGLDHPMREAILDSQSRDADEVAAGLTGSIPGQRRHFYQKHMAQHMVPGMPRGWMGQVTNVFLIRHPVRVVASFAAKYERPELSDLGFVQLAELYEEAVGMGQSPVVVDSADIRANPEAALKGLCRAIGLEFTDRMLSWPAGGHPDDGVWAAHWYGAVHKSTGFAGAEGPLPGLEGREAELADAAMPYYEQMATARLKVSA